MDHNDSKNRKRDTYENPASEYPKYKYQDHYRYAKEKISSIQSLSEEETRRFKDGAIKVISEIYEKHTGLMVDINNPPPIAMDLSRTARNATAGASNEMGSFKSFKEPDPVTTFRRSLRAHSEESLTGSTSDDVMIAKKSYRSYSRSRRQGSKKHSRRSYTSTATHSENSVPPVSPTVTSLQEPGPSSPFWYTCPSSSTVSKDSNKIINLESDEE